MGINLDISPQHLKDLLAMLRQYLPDTLVWAFGSRVKFTAKPASDLDLVAFVPEKQQTRLSSLKEALAESDLPFKVDLHDWNDLPETFRKNIETSYVVIQEAKNEEAPSEWKTYKLGEIAEVQTGPFGSQLHSYDYQKNGIPVIMPVNIGDNKVVEHGIARISEEKASSVARHLTKEGDIIYSRRGDIERKAYITFYENGWICGTGCLKIRPKQQLINSKYLSYFLGTKEPREYLRTNAVGTTMPNLNTGILSSIEIKAPDLPTQIQIASLLSSLDDKIELNLQMNRTLEAMAQAIFKEWFVEFRYPGADGVLVDGVPIGWKLGSILEIAYLLSGGTPKTENERFWNGDIKWISAKDVTTNNGNFVVSTEKSITQEGLKNSSAKLLPKYSTVISARGTVGNYCIIPEEMTISQSNYGLKSKKEYGDFFLFLMLENMIELMKAYSYGTVFDTITTKTFKEMEVVIPDETIATAFNSLIEPLYLKIYSNSIQNQNLSHLRDSLLPRLMTGQIEIKN